MPEITITGKDGSFSAYLATPAAGSGPGIVVIQEIFGVNRVMRDICDDLAGQGYLALCPDLFWRQEPGIQLTDQTEAEWTRAFELYQGFDESKGTEDLTAALDHLRGRDERTGKAGTVGHCLGGKLVYLMATRSDADCNVSYYGVDIEANLDEAKNITKPLLMHIAEADQSVPAEAQQAIKDKLAGNSLVTIHSYPGLDHAFCRVGGQNYDRAGADLSNRRTADFLKAHLA